MSLRNFTTDYWIYERAHEDSAEFGKNMYWRKIGVFSGALARVRQKETGLADRPGAGQVVDVSERFTLYISDDSSPKPEFDDFIKCVNSGYEYRVLSNPMSRRTPDKSHEKYCICEVIRSRIPGNGDVYE